MRQRDASPPHRCGSRQLPLVDPTPYSQQVVRLALPPHGSSFKSNSKLLTPFLKKEKVKIDIRERLLSNESRTGCSSLK